MSTLNIIEIFASIQGETSLSGLPTTFIRLAACNLRCSWCDTTYSFGRGTTYTLESILEQVDKNRCKQVCVTGGEPLLQENVHPLMKSLCDKGYAVSLETSGSLPTDEVDPRVRIILDIKCPGSGMSHKNLWANLDLLRTHDEIKFVVKDRHDYDYAKQVCMEKKLFEKPAAILLSPVYGEMEPKSLVEWILQDHLPVRLNLQIHKFIWSSDTKGV